MLALLFEEPTEELDGLEPLDRQPPAEFVQELLAVFTAALGIEEDQEEGGLLGEFP